MHTTVIGADTICVCVSAGKGRYKLMAADLVATHSMMDHIGRYLPSVRMNGAAFSFVVDLIINYGSPVLHLVMVRKGEKDGGREGRHGREGGKGRREGLGAGGRDGEKGVCRWRFRRRHRCTHFVGTTHT
jgi:hypothetical protein